MTIALRIRHVYVKSVLLEKDSAPDALPRLADRQWVDMSRWEKLAEGERTPYFEEKMQEILFALESDEVTDYDREMKCLEGVLEVHETMAREQQLLRRSFIGRDWLTSRVLDWMSNGNEQRMVLLGVPGSGKSAFAANLVQYCPDVIAGIFLTWDNSECRDIDRIIRLLCYKLAASLPDYRRMLYARLDSDRREMEKQIQSRHKEDLFHYLILEPLTGCIEGNRPRSLIVIDGLDETSDEAAALLYRKLGQLPDWIRTLFISRLEETRLPSYAGAAKIVLDDESKENHEDLRSYLSMRFGLEAESELVRKMAAKCESSFLYAVLLSDSLNESAPLTEEVIDALPAGIHAFYYETFRRLFPTREAWRDIRPAFELLAIDEELPMQTFCDCLGVDEYELWEIRRAQRGLVISTANTRQGALYGTYKTLRFVHKSIRDWITKPEAAGDYYVRAEAAYRLLAAVYEGKYGQTGEHEMGLKEFIRLARQRESFTEKGREQLDEIINSDYPKWLAKGGLYEIYENLLLASFDAEELRRKMREKNLWSHYTWYYQYYTLWRWADLFPANYPMDRICAKLKEIVLFPREYMCSQFTHRSYQISLLLLASLMGSGRYSEVFNAFIRQFNFDGYFLSSASDMDGETRDGWDKYYMARDAAICLRTLQAKKIEVPEDVRCTCERMKFTYQYYMGKTEGGMFMQSDELKGHGTTWTFGILSEPALAKDICRLHPEDIGEGIARFEEYEPLIRRYNTMSLRWHFAHTDDTDFAFVSECITYQADPEEARRMALQDLMQGKDPEHLSSALQRRIAYIRETASLDHS